MPRAKLSDAQAIPSQTPPPQGGKANLSDTTYADGTSYEDGNVWVSKEPVNFSAPLTRGSIPWMKEKAHQFLNWTVNQIPTVEAAGTGFAGGLIGEAVEPAGGGIPGAVAGAGIGGAHGAHDRQRVIDAFNLDPYAKPKTMREQLGDMTKEGLYQAGAELVGAGIGKAMRPALESSLAKLYSAGGIDYGEGTGEGRLKTVAEDLMKSEKASGKAVTVKDFIDVIGKAKDDTGKIADAALSAPVNVGGRTVLLRDMSPNPTPLANLIKGFATKDAGLVKRASLAGTDRSVTAAKKYMQMIKDRALTFEQKPWTYGELARERMRINQELSDFYGMTPGEKQAFLKANPLFEVDKAIADHIRDVSYPEMDKAAGFAKGTTKKLQEKRGILMQMDTEVRKNLNKLQNKTVQAQGEGFVDKVSPSGYLTSEGKPGASLHRVQRLVHTPNGIASANKKVSQAFGHAPLTVARKNIASPAGSKELGNQILTMPLQILINPPWKKFEPTPKPSDDEATPEPQSSVATPKELIDRAKQFNPAAQGQVAYNHVAVNPVNGHRIGSHDGNSWYDHATGEQVA